MLDLLLLTFSIGYICGLIALGQNTTMGADLMRWIVKPFSPLAELWVYAPLMTAVTTGILGYILNESPKLAPRLFLRMYLVAILTGMGMTACLRGIEIDPVPIVGMLLAGSLLFLPLWILHQRIVGNKITSAHLSVVLAAAFTGVGPFVYLMPDLYMRS
ncbi:MULTISPECIES: hypothetical protein [Pirellulaceae]|uniref:hypothetical protein n=1 Tax=Pirellulaceae TaxID=2691357 RepID=UPI0011B0DF1E|nr:MULTISPECIES: hypothetical protein [Pirellulaceae]